MVQLVKKSALKKNSSKIILYEDVHSTRNKEKINVACIIKSDLIYFSSLKKANVCNIL